MDNVILSSDERNNYISLCALISGYHESCYEKMDDTKLKQEYEVLNNERE